MGLNTPIFSPSEHALVIITRIHEISLTVTKILIIYESAKYAFTGNH